MCALLAVMQRIAGLAARRELGACRPGACAWRTGPTCDGQPVAQQQQQQRRWCWWAGACVRPARPFSEEPGGQGRRLCRRKCLFVGHKHRLYSSRPGGAEGPAGGSGASHPAVSVVGSPDPITWLRCKVVTYLIYLYFELDLNSVEFESGVKQALIHVSDRMARGRYHELRGIVSHEMVDYAEERCRALTNAQRRQLAVTMEDIIFLLPEDVSVVFDQYGRTFCFVAMRFWLLSTHEGPDDPEGTKIFKVMPSEDGSPQKKLATAVYEFHRELTKGSWPDWTVTTIWHWHWKAAE